MSLPVTVKVVLLGNSGVGKTSISLRFAEDTFEAERKPTVGAAFLTQTITVRSEKVKFNIWDTAGQERYRAMAKMYYQDAQAAILVYDITDKESFKELKNWYRELKDNGPEDITIAVAANKMDLCDDEVVNEEEARNWARSIGATYRKTCSKTNSGIEGLFADLVHKHTSMQSFETGRGVRVGKVKEGGKGQCSC